jgi:hypothetical protein
MTVSLVPANIEYLAFAAQADKDTAASAPDIAIVLEDESLDPGVQVLTTAESDRSAQQGQRIVVGAQPGGTFRKYVRPNEEDFFLAALLGKSVDTPGSPNAHAITIDPAAPFFTPYLTCWQVWPGKLALKYVGCRIAQGVFTSQPGQALSVEYTLAGLSAVYLDAEPTVTDLFDDDELPHVWPELTGTLGGVHDGTINNLSLTVSRNTGRFEGDNGLTSLDVPNGLVAITGSLEVAFQNDDFTRAANTGSTSGTALTTDIYDTSLVLDFLRAAGAEEVKFDLESIQITNLRTALKTDASPAVTTFDFNAKRVDDISTLLVATVKNGFIHADRNPPS